MNCFAELKARQRDERHAYPDNLGLRVHRALSWLKKAEACQDDDDAQFIFLWIAFNSAYANDVDKAYRIAEHQTFDNFINKLCRLDKQGRLANIVWQEFAGSVRVLLDNEYVFQPFWDYQNGQSTEQQWKQRFNQAKGYLITHKAQPCSNTFVASVQSVMRHA